MLEKNVIAYGKSLFMLDGELDIMLDDRTYRLIKGDYALVLCGSAHSLRSGTRNDTFFMDEHSWPAIVTGIDSRDARTRFVGRYNDKQLPPPGNLQRDGYNGAGAQGIRQNFMIDRTTGSAHMAMVMVEFAAGGGGSHHTHPFENRPSFSTASAIARSRAKTTSSSRSRVAGPASGRSTQSMRAAKRVGGNAPPLPGLGPR